MSKFHHAVAVGVCSFLLVVAGWVAFASPLGCQEAPRRPLPPDPSITIGEVNKGLLVKSTEIQDSAQNQLAQTAVIMSQNPPASIAKPTGIISEEARKIIVNAQSLNSVLSVKLITAETEAKGLRTDLLKSQADGDKLKDDLVAMTKKYANEKAARENASFKLVVALGAGLLIATLALGALAGFTGFSGNAKGAYFFGSLAGACFIGMSFCFAVSKYYDQIAMWGGIGLAVVGAMIMTGVIGLFVVLWRRQKAVSEVVQTTSIVTDLFNSLVNHAEALANKPLAYTQAYLAKLGTSLKDKMFAQPLDAKTPGIAYHIQSPSTVSLVAGIREKLDLN